jgi:membrane-bound inhibitor of C-type lysozyme
VAHLQQRQHTVVVEFVPLGLDWPVSILEVAVQPEPAVVDRTLRYHCPERELLHVEVPLADLPGAAGPLLAAAAAGRLTVAASRADVGVSVLGTATTEQQAAAAANQQQQQQQQQPRVCLRYRCGDAREAVQFVVWLYGSTAMGQPLEAWQVRVQENSC